MDTTVTGIVLAGGQSMRMGTEKGLLKLNDKMLVEFPVALLKLFCRQILISSNNKEYSFLGLPLVTDIQSSIGPLAGLYAGLHASTSENSFFIACDMPFVDMSIIHTLSHKKEDYDIVVPSINNWPIPVCGFYKKSILSLIYNEINARKFSLQNILNKSNSLIIEIENEEDRCKLININTPEEYQTIFTKSVSKR